ncbi:JAB domain-containing protein [Pseudacidovorax intermedius]|uniref:JAB domain-containing protein n=1 Tax=Pseudacidovorax intermedius TaxID=433924 RepID=UPI003F806C5D
MARIKLTKPAVDAASPRRRPSNSGTPWCPPRELVKQALRFRFNAAGVIVSHNHPSGAELCRLGTDPAVQAGVGAGGRWRVEYVIMAETATASFAERGLI